MKNLLLFLLFLFAFVTVDAQKKITYNEEAIVVLEDDTKLKVVFTFEENAATGELLNVRASENLLRVFEMTPEEFEEFVIPFVEQQAATSKESSSCHIKCKEKYPNDEAEYKKCRRACRWEKFGNWIKDAAKAIAPIMVAWIASKKE